MRVNWLESKAVSTLFFCSVVVCLSCFTYALFIAVPWVRNFLNTSSAINFFGILFASLIVLTIPSVLVIHFGMAIFCVFRDRSPAGAKVLWFLVYFFTGPFGSIVYYFTVYRAHIRRNRALRAGLGSAQP